MTQTKIKTQELQKTQQIQNVFTKLEYTLIAIMIIIIIILLYTIRVTQTQTHKMQHILEKLQNR